MQVFIQFRSNGKTKTVPKDDEKKKVQQKSRTKDQQAKMVPNSDGRKGFENAQNAAIYLGGPPMAVQKVTKKR